MLLNTSQTGGAGIFLTHFGWKSLPFFCMSHHHVSSLCEHLAAYAVHNAAKRKQKMRKMQQDKTRNQSHRDAQFLWHVCFFFSLDWNQPQRSDVSVALWDFVCDVCAAFAFLVDTDFRPTPSLSSFRSTPNVVIFEFECEAMFPDPESLSPCGITMKFPLFWEHTSSIGHLLSVLLWCWGARCSIVAAARTSWRKCK